jgi:hypothetical protein
MLIIQRALQRQRHDLQKQWAQLHLESLQEMTRTIVTSTDVVLSIRQDQLSAPIPVAIKEESAQEVIVTHSDPISLPNLDRAKTALKENHRNEGLAKVRCTQLLGRFRSPSWLFLNNLAAENTAQKYPAGWNFSIQIYNIRSSDSAIFELAGSGDVVGMQRLFVTGAASPFDRDENGLTLLDVRHQLLVIY